MRLKDKVAIVTGASSDIGKGIVKRFAEEGAKVILVARDLEKLEARYLFWILLRLTLRFLPPNHHYLKFQNILKS